MRTKKQYFSEMVDNPSTPHGRVFMIIIQVFILISVVSFSLETFPGESDEYYEFLQIIEIVITFIFTAEYIFRLGFNEKGLAYALSFYGIVDILSIAPFYLALISGFDVTWLKVLRLLRLLRLFKLFKYNNTLKRFGVAISMAKEELVMFGVTALLAIYISGAGIYVFENAEQPEKFSSIVDGIWWAIVTLTTVGYGDAYPITTGGKLFTFIILIVGLAIVSIPTALIAAALTEARKIEDSEK